MVMKRRIATELQRKALVQKNAGLTLIMSQIYNMCLFCVEGVLPCPVLVLSYKGPRKLQLKLQKKAVIVHTHYNFFSQMQYFFKQFYMDNNFHNDFFKKIVVKSF